ncbi:hypothetical protein JCM10908_006810 [Rhodotorula pacifica]|uniref:uncharacterized protein n=1 Tax=Rhodotorula pacifica TaxID=1495444 RepID=UPI00316B1A22
MTPTNGSNGASSTTTSRDGSKRYGDELMGSTAPLAYIIIRWLFRFVLGVFYANVVVEGEENIPEDGVPCVLTANHSNSLTDALLLVTTVPKSRRSLLRLTAKDTQFGRGTFTSWLIESAGTLPIKRPKDHKGEKVDNSVVFAKLIGALEKGDMVCLFPEGLSRYYPEISPLKQGVSRIVSDTLTRQQDNPNFRLAIQTTSIVYLHRNLFRSDVLVTFHPPIYISAASHPDLVAHTPPIHTSVTPDSPPDAHERAIRSLTASIGASIRSGILDAPSWAVIRLANTCRRLYAPLGTRLTLGDHVRLTQRFVDALSGRRAEKTWDEIVRSQDEVERDGGSDTSGGARGDDCKTVASRTVRPGLRQRQLTEEVLRTRMSTAKAAEAPDADAANGHVKTTSTDGGNATDEETVDEELVQLRADLKTYQDLLYLHGIKDDRVRNPRLLRRRIVLKRLLIRLAGSISLLLVSIPGLVLWLPVLLMAKRSSDRLIRNGPVFDTYDEVAQTKLTYGLLTGLAVLTLATLATLPLFPFNLVCFTALMWLTLRFLEDLTSSVRAALALLRLLLLGKRQLVLLRSMREDLHARVERLAVMRAGLPKEAGVFVKERERRWRRLGLGLGLADAVGERLGYFNPRRRRKKDWNEALKLFDQTEYAEDEHAPP